jgi:hypothetical protein
LKELSGRVIPDQALEALSASYFDSNLVANESSCTKVLGEVWSIQSSYMGVERKPNWVEQMERNSSLPQADIPRR